MSWACRVKRIGLALALALPGCALTEPMPSYDRGFHGQNAQATVNPPEVADPTPTELDLTGLPSTTLPPSSSRPDRALGERECLDLAARNSTLGNLFDQKARDCCATGNDSPSAGQGPGVPPSPGGMQGEMLGVAAIEARNASVGTAMELYYRLAQAQAQRGVVDEGLAVIERALNEGKLLEAKGVKAPETFETLRRRTFKLRDEQAELDRGIAQLSAELRRRLNLGPQHEEWRVRAVLSVKVDPTVVEPEAAIREGLNRRPELSLLRRLDQQQSTQTLKALQTALGAVAPLLAMSCRPETPSALALLHAVLGRGGAEPDGAEQTSIRALWDVYRLDREQEIVKEVRVAANDLHAHVNQVIVARDQLTDWTRELERLQAQQAKGIANYGERVEAELKRLEALSTLWEKVFAWEIASVKLRQAQFTLLP